MELYKRIRPKDWDKMIGQDEAVKTLKKMIKEQEIPHAILFTGPSGCGKTTAALILKDKMECTDFTFQNCADIRGIEDIRDVIRVMRLASKNRTWLFDEVHKMSNDAQNAMLDMLENTPAHVWFFLCTSEPEKVIKAIRTRCTPIGFKAVSDDDMDTLLRMAAKKVKVELTDDVFQRLVAASDGSPRQGLVLLEQVMRLEDEEDQLNIILSSSTKVDAIEVFRILINPRSQWAEMVKVLSNIKDDWEGIRNLILACATTNMLKPNPSPRAAVIVDAFQYDFFQSRRAGLVLACYKVMRTK